MKRFTLTLILVITTLLAFAKPPQLAVESLFKGQYDHTKGVKTSIARNGGQFYRGLTVTNNPGIVKKMVEAIRKDSSRAANYSDNNDETGRYTVMMITNNGQTIQVGLQRDPQGRNAYLFIQGPDGAFK